VFLRERADDAALLGAEVVERTATWAGDANPATLEYYQVIDTNVLTYTSMRTFTALAK
jgi:hypothetical protein